MTADAALPPSRPAVVVMGVSGSGKSTVADGIAAALGVRYVDGDSLHAPQAVARMRAGIALQDDDRWPWLDRIAAALADRVEAPGGLVVACSALKRVYRDRLRRGAPGVRFVFLDGPPALIRERLAARQGHYMPPALLESQLRTLEPPTADEADVERIAVDADVDAIVRRAVAALAALDRPPGR